MNLATGQLLQGLKLKYGIITEFSSTEDEGFTVQMIDNGSNTVIGIARANTVEEAINNILMRCVSDVRDRKTPKPRYNLSDL